MPVKERINEDLKAAMKLRDKDRTSVLRMLLSEMKYAQAAVNIHAELADDEAIKVVTTYHKRLGKSLEDYPEGERRDAIRAEMKIVDEYLPKKAGEAEVATVVDQLLAATAERNFGNLMKEVMSKLGQSGDGKVVSAVLKSKLAAP